MTLHLRPPVVAAPTDRSFWLQDARADAAAAPLEGTVHAEVAVVGGGFTGLWTALRIKEQAPETRVVILEADLCGSGASGRNGGQAHTWFAEMDLFTPVVGADEARQLCADTADSIAELERLQQSGTIDMDLRLDGWLWTASSKAQEGAWDKAVAMTGAIEPGRFRLLTADEIERRTGSRVSYVGVVEERAGTVHPAKLALGLRDLALARGIVIHERSPVLEIAPGRSCILRTARGSVQAEKVVLAANAWLSCIPELRRYLYVVGSQVIATTPVPDLLDRIGWRHGESICDSQAQVLYYQRTPEGRVIFGRGSGELAYGANIDAGFNRSLQHGSGNIRELRRVYPMLRDVTAEYDWTGPIDCTPEHIPVFDHLRGHPNIFFGMGFNGTGIAQTPVAGRILASLVLERDDRWSRSGLVGLARRTTLPPEPFRYIGGKLVRAAIRRRNAVEIENRKPDPLTKYISGLTPRSRIHKPEPR